MNADLTAIPSAAIDAGARAELSLGQTFRKDEAIDRARAVLEAASERIECPVSHIEFAGQLTDGMDLSKPCSRCGGSGFFFILRRDHPRDRVTPGGPIDVNDTDSIWRNPGGDS